MEIDVPRVALVARGRLDDRWVAVTDEGWTLVLRGDRAVARIQFDDLADLLSYVRVA